jgi:nucleoside-diphosphate-sugar epimerase
MTPRRILVTGGAGFLGRPVVCDLLAQGLEVRCLVRRADSAMRLLDAVTAAGHASSERLELVFGSLRDEPVNRAWLSGCDGIVHLAGALRGAPSVLVRQNVAATRALTDAAVTCGIRRFVLVSSLSVYASQSLPPQAVLDERCPIEPAPERRGAYVYSKVVQEAVCRDACHVHSLPLVIIRPGVIFGPGRSCLSDRVGPRLGRLLALIDPDRPLPYTFVANCASAVVSAVLTNGLEGEAFNVVDDELPTARQIVNTYRHSGGDLRIVPVPRWATTPLSRLYAWWYARAEGLLPSGFLPYVVDALYKPLRFSNATAKVRLQWQPRVDLLAALRLTIAAGESSGSSVARTASWQSHGRAATAVSPSTRTNLVVSPRTFEAESIHVKPSG